VAAVVTSIVRRLRQPAGADALLALAFGVLVLIELNTHLDDGYRQGSSGWNVPILLGVVATLAVRRRAPVVAVAAGYGIALAPSLFVAHTIFFFGTLMPLLILTYTAAQRFAPVAALISLAGPALVLVVVPIHQPHFDAGDYLFWAMLSAIAFGLGRLRRRVDVHRAALAATLAEQVRDQGLREHALLMDERTRIARELHDVVAHAVSVMVVQAGAARLAVGLDDADAREGLLAVERTGRDALLDLRRLLHVLRPEIDDLSAAPAPGVDALGELVQSLRGAGLDARLELSGAPWRLPPGLDLSIFRIAQEALTNVLKHTGPTSVVVSLRYADALELEVLDDGPATVGRRPAPGVDSGHGLIGMRERVALFGGSFEAGPHGPGWRVAVRIPREAAVEDAEMTAR